VVKLFKGVIKINIIQRGINIRVSRKRTVTLPPKDVYKTNTIRNNALNYYSESKKDLIKLKLVVNN